MGCVDFWVLGVLATGDLQAGILGVPRSMQVIGVPSVRALEWV